MTLTDAIDVRVGEQHAVHLFLDRLHLLRGGALAADVDPGHDAAVSDRQEGLRHDEEEPDRAGEADAPR